MASEFAEKLDKALVDSSTDLRNFVWRGEKKVNAKGKYVQNETRLVDASEDDLRIYYKHCDTMLNNNDLKSPGRRALLAEIEDQRKRCGVEMFYRDAIAKGSSRYAVVDSLKAAVRKAQLNSIEIEDLTLGAFVAVASEFQSLPYEFVIQGGMKTLGRFNRQHITLNFIIKQGIWFSKEERKEYDLLTKKNTEKLDAVKKALKIPSENYHLVFNSRTGLTVKELKSILSLKVKKYDEMSDEQLATLRNKLLFALEDEVYMHIAQWEQRMTQIELVAEYRKINLT